MQRVAVIAKLKPGAAEQAAELIAKGPPFEPEKIGFERHSVYLSGDQAVFVFEGGNVAGLMRAVGEGPEGAAAFGAWEPLIDGMPRLAREAYSWQRSEDPRWAGGFGE